MGSSNAVSDTLNAFLSTLSLQAKDDKSSLWILLAAAIGIASISSYVTSFGKVLFDLARSGESLNKYGAKKGAWAIVTGCTSGIGREFATQLSKAGFRVLLISRDEKALLGLQKELPKESKIHAIDFASASADSYSSLKQAISSLDGQIGVLVNNVGVSHSHPVYFHECPESEMQNVVEINVNATMRITKMALPNMLENKKGLILNVGSFAALTSSPLLAPYAGSKSFLYAWSQALGAEYEKRGISVQLLNTFFVVSNLSKIRKSNWMTPMPKAYVRSVLSHIGLRCGAVSHPYVSTPYWSHAIIQWLVDHVGTEWMWMKYTENLHIGIRKRALKKIDRQKAAAAGQGKTE